MRISPGVMGVFMIASYKFIGGLSMIVNDSYLRWSGIHPPQGDTPLIVYPG